METVNLAADQGNADAQFNLGYLYDKGQGVPLDYAQAAFLYRKAAEQGHAWAQYNLGLLYYRGRGVPRDYTEAAAWYRQAAEQGCAEAQASLGFLYGIGQGMPRDYAEAYFWYDLGAADRPDASNAEDAAGLRDDAASHLTPDQLADAQKRVRKWLEEHQAKPQ